ncbi:MAG TPA: response regulator, partial [Polyangiaceae bacterium]|nr:response regulator [Polyangiaceae bacterium]
MPKVLIFESDARFADELKRGLEQHNCQVTLVGDATEGLQLAANSRPDLILLTVELPRVNGFSVCNKLKRDPSLKSVPLIIMSSDSNEDTFSQHRRLKHSRAEDYVHKPIGLDDLLPRISALVPLSSTQLDTADEVVHIGEEHPPMDGYLEIEAESDEDTQFDTEIEAELLEVESAPPESGVDAEVDEFTENAFDALLDEEMLAAQAVDDPDSEDPDTKVDATRSLIPGYSSPPAVAISEPPISAAPVSAAPISAAPVSPRASRASELTVPRISESQALAALDPRALAERDDAIADLQEMLEAAQSEGERQRGELADLSRQCANLERELLAARTQSHGTSSIPAPSPQEILGLREALNKKDKEILELHAQLAQKSKELLGIRDTSLAYEREKTESIDRLLQIEREFHELDRQHTAIKADKEQAAKRADDFKRRIEKLTGELQERDQGLAGLREQLAAAEQAKAAAVATVSEQLQAAELQTREVQTQATEQLEAAEIRLQAAQAQAAEQLQSLQNEAAEQLQASQAQAAEQLEAVVAAAEQSKRAALAAAEQSRQEALAEASGDAEELLARALE